MPELAHRVAMSPAPLIVRAHRLIVGLFGNFDPRYGRLVRLGQP
jgi:hypothetical protein